MEKKQWQRKKLCGQVWNSGFVYYIFGGKFSLSGNNPPPEEKVFQNIYWM